MSTIRKIVITSLMALAVVGCSKSPSSICEDIATQEMSSQGIIQKVSVGKNIEKGACDVVVEIDDGEAAVSKLNLVFNYVEYDDGYKHSNVNAQRLGMGEAFEMDAESVVRRIEKFVKAGVVPEGCDTIAADIVKGNEGIGALDGMCGVISQTMLGVLKTHWENNPVKPADPKEACADIDMDSVTIALRHGETRNYERIDQVAEVGGKRFEFRSIGYDGPNQKTGYAQSKPGLCVIGFRAPIMGYEENGDHLMDYAIGQILYSVSVEYKTLGGGVVVHDSNTLKVISKRLVTDPRVFEIDFDARQELKKLMAQ